MRLFAAAVLYSALVGLYWPSLGYEPLTLDDLGQLHDAQERSFVASFTPDRYGHVRPVKSALFWLWAHDASPGIGARAALLAALLLATYLLQRWAPRASGSSAAGLAVAAVWALNPMTATVVCWLSASNLLLCQIAILLYLECSQRALAPIPPRIALFGRGALQTRPSFWHALALLCLAFAMLSHELAVVAPVLLIAERTLLRAPTAVPPARSSRALYASSALMVLVFVGYALALRLTAGAHALEYRFAAESRWLMVASAARYVAQNAQFWLLPAGRFGVLLRDQPSAHLLASALCWAGLIAAAVVLWKLRRRDPVISYGLVWCAATLVPVANFVPLGNTPVAMHYAVLPGAGLALALVRALQRIALRVGRNRPIAAPILGAAFALGLGLAWLPATASAVHAWGDEAQLFASTVANHPGQVEPLVNLASLAVDHGQYPRAAELLDRASALAPEDLGVLQGRFALLWQTERLSDALALLDQHPSAAARPEFQLGRGQALARLGRPAEAARALRVAYEARSPELDAELRFAAGQQLMLALLQSEQRAEAERVLDRLLAEYPDRPELKLTALLLRGRN